MTSSDRLFSEAPDKNCFLPCRALSLVGSFAAAAGIVFPALWWMVVVGLALFFASLHSGGGGFWNCATRGLFFGIVTGAAGVAWFWQVLPLDFLDIRNRWVQVAAVGTTWAYVSLSLALPVAVFAVLLRAFRKSPFFPLACAVLWPLAEIGRMWCFALATWAPRSLLGPHFSAAALGYALAEQPLLLQLARPWGLDALNFAAGLIAGLLALIPDLFREPRMRRPVAAQGLCLMALLVFASITAHRGSTQPSTKLRVAIISENIEAVRDYEKHQATKNLVVRAAEALPAVDVVVLPEEIGLTSMFFSKQEVEEFMRDHFKTRDVLIMNTRSDFPPFPESTRSRKSKKLFYDGTTSGEMGCYVKHMLMPLGEYAPWSARPLFSIFRDKDLQLHLEKISDLPTNRQPLEAVNFRGWRIGGLLCSDLLSPRLYRDLAVHGKADALINLSNPFWFHGSHLLHWKTLQMAKVHAVQNRLPLLVSNNLAPSFAVGASGRLVAESSWNSRDVLYVTLPLGDE